MLNIDVPTPSQKETTMRFCLRTYHLYIFNILPHYNNKVQGILVEMYVNPVFSSSHSPISSGKPLTSNISLANTGVIMISVGKKLPPYTSLKRTV